MKAKVIVFTAILQKFAQNGEKTGWTYIPIPQPLAQQLKPGNKKSFRVKGIIDNYTMEGVSLLPMGDGSFIIPINSAMRKAIAKGHGSMVAVTLLEDEKKYQLNKDLVACLADDPEAKSFFEAMPPSHQNYYSKWIDDAKTEATKIKRLSQTLFGMANKMNYSQTIRHFQSKEK